MTNVELAANRLGETLGTYATGYLDAARVLFQHAADGEGLVDLYFYPAAHALRHGVELLAKHFSDHIAYELREPKYLYVQGHSLEEAWARVRVEVREIVHGDYSNSERNDLLRHVDTIDALVTKLHALDPTGMLFRYPEAVSQAGSKNGPKIRTKRVDTHVPGDSVPLEPWIAETTAAVTASQYLGAYFEERAAFLQDHRHDPPARLGDLVLDQVPPKLQEAWEKHRASRPRRDEP